MRNFTKSVSKDARSRSNPRLHKYKKILADMKPARIFVAGDEGFALLDQSRKVPGSKDFAPVQISITNSIEDILDL